MAELIDEAASTASARLLANTDDNRPVIGISGELDMSNVEHVRSELAKISAGKTDSAIFDLRELAFMDSSGIALLLQFADRLGGVTLRNASTLIQRIIQATGVAEVLRIES